ncbi:MULTISPECIES: hypothetical protein [Actinobacillus]|uniref:Uncharacterized protein n=1 Tax=Actinobacillus lignieresii TaxID=720 RepID=A0A380TUR2_ACTLI|nr:MULTISPECIES: hypothetical protein [Actinobacillus]WGE76058.1 hypothetical protein NYR81_03700 [Actinobacillus equuli subsp. haemolyticus]WGE78072.1 hypothetical protein NYR82_04330 [Actinobacillus equuli subsp. haemolyticus]SUT91443.1 Uncharacterised protein [Actinobacillus lignieresii]
MENRLISINNQLTVFNKTEKDLSERLEYILDSIYALKIEKKALENNVILGQTIVEYYVGSRKCSAVIASMDEHLKVRKFNVGNFFVIRKINKDSTLSGNTGYLLNNFKIVGNYEHGSKPVVFLDEFV